MNLTMRGLCGSDVKLMEGFFDTEYFVEVSSGPFCLLTNLSYNERIRVTHSFRFVKVNSET